MLKIFLFLFFSFRLFLLIKKKLGNKNFFFIKVKIFSNCKVLKKKNLNLKNANLKEKAEFFKIKKVFEFLKRK
jgi:hypothetical protein